jgi:hypothetical protein
MQTQLFWILDSKAYNRSKYQWKKMSYEGDMSFQIWHMDLWEHTTPVDSEIVNKNIVDVDTKIINETASRGDAWIH